MKSILNSRRGSALLVVLGMLAFMLFSGLAFSVYMRQSRLPTSFLRRTVATRQLAKAALAEAIENIDEAIGNDPHPGIRVRNYVEDELGNFWTHRVFTGLGSKTNPERNNNNSGNSQGTTQYYPALVDPDETVPTLTLEGLAYLPPCLVNEARYYSQRTPTAKWHSFWFDSGRYAYTAIDVSDYFDVNRVYANKPRSSCARVSFAHLFEQMKQSDEVEGEFVHSGSGSGADTWDDFMEDYRVASGNLPLISLADLNVAWGSGSFDFGGRSLGTPFNNFVTSGSPYQNAGQGNSGSDALGHYREMTFVTDGWFPQPQSGKTADGETIYDLASEANQPFDPEDLKGTTSLGMRDIIADTYGLFGSKGPFENSVNWLTKVALWDYLDQNKVPTSLAIPTCEQVPMVCGIQPQVNGIKLSVSTLPEQIDADDKKEGEPYADGEDQLQNYSRTVTYLLDLNEVNNRMIRGNVLLAYPFLLKGQEPQTVNNTSASVDSFTLDGRVSVFLTSCSLTSARPGWIGDDDRGEGLFLKDDASVKESTVFGPAQKSSVVTFAITKQANLNPEDICTDSSETGAGYVDGKQAIPVREYAFTCDSNPDISTARELVKVTYVWPKMRKSKDSESWVFNRDPLPSEITQISKPDNNKAFAAFAANGNLDQDYDFLKSDTGKKTVAVNLAVCLRVTDRNGKTVDLVPASVSDDRSLNGINNSQMANKLQDTSHPVLYVQLGTVEFSREKFDKGDLGTFELTDQQFTTGDPRYNHAPEDWKLGTAISAAEWFRREHGYAKDKDGDIYMATSDQAFMQSVYELAFLPRLQNGFFDGSGGGFGNYAVDYNGKIRTANETLMHHDVMWTTYSPFGRYNVDDFDELGDGRIVSGDSGMKVNPYSDSKEVLMAAFANTPHDWRMAFSNNPEVVKYKKAKQFNEDHAWNGYCEKERGSICWDCLRDLAEKFHSLVRTSNYAGDWEGAFRDLGWSYLPNELLSGNQLDSDDSNLFGVDKKFLYGFWRDSFAARQQLFLIFVRAEPMMMGGGVAGQAPPQLGARAVALVWRDPTKTQNRSSGGSAVTLANPHRTRILFYHQFD